MAYPSTLTTFVYPNPTQRLNNPSQSSIVGNLNNAVTQLEAFIGTDASALGTLVNDVRSPDSGGGGHIQAVNKGGTGQTNYQKGDLLVGQSSSVLVKQAVGSNGKVLQADDTQAAGIKWGTVGGKIAISFTPSTLSSIAGEGSILSATIASSTLGTSGGVRVKTWITHLEHSNATNGSVLLSATYGNTRVASVLVIPDFSTGSVAGRIEFNLFARGNVSSQFGVLDVLITNPRVNFQLLPTSVISAIAVGVSNVNSDVDQPIGLTMNNGISLLDDDKIITQGYTVETI